ncbi:MAG: NAD(P)H-binding protein, partial [Leadbetterella sp.]|nr:NAD(P)H-binding protein [Leadbetterella sp.]
MQVLLGAGGDIGTFLAKELKPYTSKIRLVGRNPVKVNADDELFPGDLLDADRVNQAVAGAKVAYLVAGLKYDSRIWKKQWPVIMKNVIDACVRNGSKLVFFDNVYMYDKTAIPHMTEESALNPPSEKGKVRREIVQLIEEARTHRGCRPWIAR